MNPEQATGARIGSNGVALTALESPPDDLPEASGPADATATAAAEPDAPTYRSFRELPRITHVSGAVIVALGLAALILSLFEVQWNGLLWLFGQRDLAESGEAHFSMTGEEIRTILSASEQEGALNPQLTKMLRGVFDLDEHTARDAMIPRTEVDAVEISATVADILALYKEDLRERYPVYETSVDNIIGVVPMKELLNRIASNDYPETSMDISGLPGRDVMMPAYYVPDTMPLSDLLDDFTSNRRQIAIVLDEYGGTEGLITLEDILEEIVGDYEDEFTPRHRHIRKEGEHNFVINGGVRVTELEPKLHYPFPSGDYVTLGGLIHHRLGRIAAVGDVLLLEGARLEVLEHGQTLGVGDLGLSPQDERPEAAVRRGCLVLDAAAGDGHPAAPHDGAVDELADPQLGAVPGHVRMRPLEPGQERSVG